VSGKYRFGRLIGGGGMAEVYEATAIGAEGFARPVAIKRMLPALSLDPSFGQMFVNEARIASLLHHENIVSVLDFDRDADGRYFLVMELVSGVDLRRLASSGPLPWGVIAFLLAGVLNGLGYAHELEAGGRALRIVHRDVSPHNVMVSWDGAVKIVDFGIAKALAATGASRSNTLKGKMAYMSPEQAHGLELDGRADVFAVGVMGHELITGQKLFPGQTEVEVLARLLTQPIQWPRAWRPDVPADLEAVVMQMLERDRDARFANAQAAQEALLATSVVDPRAQIALRELLRQRFAEAPRRRGESQPGFVATPSGPVPIEDTTHTAPGGAARAMMGEVTRTAQPTPRPDAPRSRAGMWIAIAVAVIAVGVAVAVIATRGGDASKQPAAASPVIDARAVSAATIDAPAPLDAAQLAAVAPSPDAAVAAIAAPVDRHHHHADAGAAPAPLAPPDAAPAPAPPDAAPPPAPPDAAPTRPGTLIVKVAPWAHIYVDGALAGDTPFGRGYPPGDHTLRMVNEELSKDETITITIISGQPTEIRRTWGAE
jgi:hypothetical protein